MSDLIFTADQINAIVALANGIIPPDENDGGAALNAGLWLAEKIGRGVDVAVYGEGLQTAAMVARERFNASVSTLTADAIYELLGILRDQVPGFFKQLRMDTCAIYMGDARVWKRIGFPGPSTDSGGYPDFDQPQNGRPT
jgi:hypothetical protein